MQLKGKTIVVTGAGRGLGQKTAEMIAAKGGRLALVDLSEDDLEETAQLCRDAGGEARVYPLDVSEEEAVEQVFARVVEDFGALDGLISNAGITRDGLLVKGKGGQVEKKMSTDDWNAVLQVDLRGVFLCGREAAAHMIELGKGGAIVNISSISRAGNFGQTNYSAAKSGVTAMTVTWAKELARHGIRAAAIAPGFCNTAMVAKMPEKILDTIKDQVPLGRLAEPAEIGHSVIYVLENDYFNGRVLEIDGGLRL
ncbi:MULTISPECIES: SDR family oxidoreductase [Halomonas]|uniref:3-oxoacyl-[acyl-carrier protein] reductase n=1 Tax=Halomonas ventosae TaxID=229007 RepID=A0A4R6H3V1_9GAMM|nr:SDR family oxidoreductase [Halomonas ventosae]TDO02497.1 3-oxoacyl-[acyl-carrier protein] reductase [Halomonas ventosae]